MDNNYKKYLNSKEWKDKANKRMEKDRFLCQDCGAAYNLVVHHLTYDRIYHEDMKDLTTLCKKCHAAYHLPRKSEQGSDDMSWVDTFVWGNVYEQRINQYEAGNLLKAVGGDCAVLGYILMEKDEDGILTTHIKEIAEKTGVSRAGVISAIMSFEENNLISVLGNLIGAKTIEMCVNPALGVYGEENRKEILKKEYHEFRRKSKNQQLGR